MSFTTGLIAYTVIGLICVDYGATQFIRGEGLLFGGLFLIIGIGLIAIQIMRYIDRDDDEEV